MQLEMEMEMEMMMGMEMGMEMEISMEMGMEKTIQKIAGIKKSQQRHTAQEPSASGAIFPLGCKQLSCESELLAQYKHKKKKAPHAFDMMNFSKL